MNYLKFLLLILPPIILASCGDSGDKKVEKIESVEKPYDYRDEKYQDFYSVYRRNQDMMQRNGNAIEEKLNSAIIEQLTKEQKLKGFGEAPIPADLVARYFIRRVDSFGSAPLLDSGRSFSKLKSKEDLLSKIKVPYSPCLQEEQMDGLFCIRTDNYLGLDYYYFPNESKKIAHINQFLNFSCNRIENKYRSCSFNSYPNPPYNINLRISFSKPDEFFYIVSYTDYLFYTTTGEHIWQTSSKQ